MNELQILLNECEKSNIPENAIVNPEVTFQIVHHGIQDVQDIVMGRDNVKPVNDLLDSGWSLNAVVSQTGFHEYDDVLYSVKIHRAIFMEMTQVRQMFLPLYLIDLEADGQNPYKVWQCNFPHMTEMDELLFRNTDGIEILDDYVEDDWNVFEFMVVSKEPLNRSHDE